MHMPNTTTETYDVVIIGAGPAGASAAAILAEHGRRVLVLEKETLPRYAIGESLIPYCYFPLERLGLIDTLNAGNYQTKHSVQFVRRDGKVSQPFYFSKHFDHPAAQTWQVSRETFDMMLVDNARAKGAEVREGVKVTQSLMHEDKVIGVRATSAEGEHQDIHAPITIDASGRGMFAITRNDWRVQDPALKKIAIWTYYEGAMRDPGIDEGATTVAYVSDKNWFWYIPMTNNRVSVGIVGEAGDLYREGVSDPQHIFEREAQKNAWIQSHLSTGKPIAPHRVTSDFSYRSRYVACDGMVLVGDAMGFLDPVFSSGVMLALRSGVLVGDAVNEALEQNDTRAERFQSYGETMRDGYEAMRMLVYAFYDENFSFKALFEKYPNLRHDLTDCLIGNVERDYTELAEALNAFGVAPSDTHAAETLGVPERANHPNHTGHR
jgi:flavin-dependent dehydrogenase